MPVVPNVRIRVEPESRLECDSPTIVVHVTVIISAHAVARMLLPRPLSIPSAPLVCRLVAPGAPAPDAKSTAVVMMDHAPALSRLKFRWQAIAGLAHGDGTARSVLGS